MKLYGISAVVLLQLTSCVGVAIVGGQKEEHVSFGINETRSKPMRRVMASESGKNPTRNKIQSNWGKPDRQYEKDGDEVWSYQSGMAIRGAVPMLGLALPLVVPVGKNRYEFHFPDGVDRADKLVVGRNDFWGGYYGVSAFSDSKSFGFHKLGD